MSTAAQVMTETLVVKHQYDFKPGLVFQAWSSPEALGQWFGPHSHKCIVEEYDFRESGHYQVRMVPISEDSECGGDSTQDSVCAGQFVRIIPDKIIVMTFSWIENGADIGETLLTVEFKKIASGTEIILTHEKLPNQEIADMHKGGWQGSLECLELFLSK